MYSKLFLVKNIFHSALVGLLFMLTTLAIPLFASDEADVPPYQWGDAGVRECMIETSNRWHSHNATPMPASEISTHGPRVPAFPGAEGFGAWSFGGRGGELYRVTNLNDSGPGSLREAAEAKGSRIIIFDVSGTIELESPIRIYNPYATFAGQTAPGDGITVKGGLFYIGTYDVILRHMRFRHGVDPDQEPYSSNVNQWTLRVGGGNHVILDHVTISWGMDGNLGVTRMDNVTVQNSVLAKPLWNSVHFKGIRGYGALVRGRHGARYSFLRNIWANNRARVPRPGNYLSHTEDPDGLLVDFRNNVIYMGIGANYDEDSITKYNFVNNYFLTDWRLIDRSTYTQAYMSGNFHVNPERMQNQWLMIDAGDNVNRNYHEQSKPFDVGMVTTLSAEKAWEQVISGAGAWIRDDHDNYVVQEIKNHRLKENKSRDEQYHLPDWWKVGAIDNQIEVGGLPDLKTVTIPEWIDTNRNGLPDWWERARGLDSDNPEIANIDSNGNGYTNIEDYFNDLDAVAITHAIVGFSSR